MVFNSFTFLLFLCVVLVVHHLPLPWTLRKINLILFSYLFYAAWFPPYVLLLWFCTLVDWFIARALVATEVPRRRRFFLILSIVANLSLLGFFKYTGFLVRTLQRLAALVSLSLPLSPPDILLPIGISFFVFMSLSYTIDIYYRRTRPARSFLDYALFITFFSHLISGPIVRAADFLPQCDRARRANARQFAWGACLLVCGLFQKTVIADYVMGPASDALFNRATAVSALSAWVGTMAFSMQILADFSGYTMCAVGAALMLGFAFPDNFRYPYAAVGFSDFWRRWHISLSSWLRDYLYIPLGGNRRGATRTQINLMLTMLLGGLWHGASWHFVLWGGLHGGYLVIERPLRRCVPPAWKNACTRPLAALLTYLAVCIAWVFFRADTMGKSGQILRSMLLPHHAPAVSLYSRIDLAMVVGLIAGILLIQWYMRERTLEEIAARLPWWLRAGALAGMLAMILLATGEDRAFIYFQF